MKYNFDLDLNSKNSVSMIIDKIKEDSTVLEFGPANGRMTKYLQENLNCTVYTVELDTEAAKDAAKYSKEIIVGNIEDYEWLIIYKDIKFDYIIFADVLEHLYYPEKVLLKSKQLLNPDGSILFSIPNIAHNAIIMELLENKFTYSSVGLLDNTHIRFFTKQSLDKMVEEVGLYKKYEGAFYLPPLHTELHKNYDDFSNQISDALQKREFAEVYQFVYELKLQPTNIVSELDIYEEFKLFYDDGSGFTEAKSIVSSLKKDKVIFEFTSIKNISKLRIDPSEKAVKLKIDYIKVNEIVYKDQYIHNGLNQAEIIKFLHNDPQIIIEFNQAIDLNKVVIKVEYFEIIKNLSNEIITNKDQQLKEKEQQLQEKEQQLQEKEQQLQEKEQQLQHKELEIQKLIAYNIELAETADSMRIKNRIKNLFQFRKKVEYS